MFCCCLVPLLILAEMVKPCGDEGFGDNEYCKDQFGFGDLFLGMFSNFIGLGTGIPRQVQDYHKSQEDKGGAEVSSQIWFALAAVLGKVWLVLWALSVLYFIWPKTRLSSNPVPQVITNPVPRGKVDNDPSSMA